MKKFLNIYRRVDIEGDNVASFLRVGTYLHDTKAAAERGIKESKDNEFDTDYRTIKVVTIEIDVPEEIF